VKTWAEENNVPYLQPEKLTELPQILNSRGFHPKGDLDEGLSDQKLQSAKYDFFLIVAYGKIIPEEILNMPRLGSLNIHYSLLPKYRGASPVEASILAGDTETGVTIQQIEFKLDSGPILASEKTAIGAEESAPALRERLIKIGGELLIKILPEFLAGKFKSTPQEEKEASHCKKIKKEDGLVDPNGDPVQNYNKFRAYTLWPRVYFFKDGKRVVITEAALENGSFIIKRVIPEGRKEISYADFLRQEK
jgi:methionyl-tRNA formyltransferase